MGPPTVWLMYVVAGAGAGAAEEAAMVVRRRRRVMATRFAIALRLDLMSGLGFILRRRVTWCGNWKGKCGASLEWTGGNWELVATVLFWLLWRLFDLTLVVKLRRGGAIWLLRPRRRR
ncbi:hypothetical protein ACLB2K_072204 [Fragaria x ananassa]